MITNDRRRKARILENHARKGRYAAYNAAGDDLYREIVWKAKPAAEKRRIKRKHAAKRKAR